ncbi:MAG: HD domain-containing protein, partial [Chloroflexi bacterium]|nr:HD domain-containing protein [Chloroflexota bacterium]
MAGRASVSPHARDGRAGAELSAYLTECLDAAMVDLSQEARGWAVVAIGGYGRGDLARHSDIDVLLLVEDGAEDRALRSLYPLWDASLKVGHAIRSLREVADSARANIETYTALLDARFLAGDLHLHEEFARDRQVWVRKTRDWLRGELSALRAARIAEEPWQTLAVDVKNSRGGLRGLHALHWLEAANAISDGARETPSLPAMDEARETLMRTRHAVHALSDRPTDVYRPEIAAAVAEWLDVDTMDWGRTLFTTMREVDAAHDAALRPAEVRRGALSRWLPGRGGGAVPADPVTDEPVAQLRADLHNLDGGGPLDPFGRAVWIDALLPEWESLRARPHIAPFHIHPVDVHAARTVVEARAVMEGDEFDRGTRAIADAFGHPNEVLLAALLHDIGKGHAGVQHPEAGAVIVERFASRAGLEPAVARRLVAAVRHHLLLPAVATRRDIADAQVIQETADAVGDFETLCLLYLLSIADARASGPTVWNQWKAQLMRALFDRVSVVLGQVSVAPSADAVVEALAGRFSAEVVRAHLAGLDASYLLSTAPVAVGDHIALIEAAAAAPGGAAARRDTLGEIDRVTMACPDRPGLLQDIAGTFAGFNASILGGVAYTRDDAVVIQVWHVGDALNGGRGAGIDDRRWERILDALPRAARQEFDIEARLDEVRRNYPQPRRREDIETKVYLDNRASRDYSVLEVSAPDRRGLLYAVTRALHEMRIDIHLAKVDTIGPEIVDAF